MASTKKERSAPRPGARAAVLEGERGQGSSPVLCTCCDPANPLVMRPDLGVLADGSAEFALCVLHEPDPVVYRNRGDGEYVQMTRLSLSPAGDVVDAQGRVVARVQGDDFQQLVTVDDDEPPLPDPGSGPGAGPAADPERASRPRTVHVDLTEDDFYRP